MEKTIKSSEVYYHSEVLELKKRERIVTFTKNNIHNSFHPCARQCSFRRHQSRQQMRANFYSATLGAIHLTQLQMHHLTFSHTAFRQRWQNKNAVLRCPQLSKSCRAKAAEPSTATCIALRSWSSETCTSLQWPEGTPKPHSSPLHQRLRTDDSQPKVIIMLSQNIFSASSYLQPSDLVN